MSKGASIYTAALLLAALAAPACVKDGRGVPVGPGECIPPFSTMTLEGRTVTDRDLLGKPSVVIFFSTTCPDCHRQLPEAEAVHIAAGEDANVLAIAREEDRETVSAFWTRNGFTMPCAAPGDRRIYDLFDRGSRSGVPLVYLTDGKGVVIGFTDDRKTLPADEMLRILNP